MNLNKPNCTPMCEHSLGWCVYARVVDTTSTELTREDFDIETRLIAKGHDVQKLASEDTEDFYLMKALMRWKDRDRVAYRFERAFAGLHSSEIVED